MKYAGLLGGVVFAALAGFGLVLYAAEGHPSPTYIEYCARCHGEDGTANTPKGKKLKAQDFTDAEWQAEEEDEELIKVVTEGDMDMPPFGKKLSREQIESLVRDDVRGFVKK